MKYPFLANLNLDNLVIDKLTLHLNNLVRGNNLVLLTPIGEKVGPDVILKEFDSIFNSPSNLSLLDKDILSIELANRSKYGPRSISQPWSERKSSLLNYFANHKIGPDLLNYSVSSRDRFKLRPISYDMAIKTLKNSTNSGLPFFTKKGLVKPLYASSSHLANTKSFYPSVLFTRTQEGNKTRDVWGYCMAATIFESRYYRPLLDYQKKLSWRSALLGPNDVDRRVTDLVNSSLLRGSYLLSIDFSKYDASISGKLINYAFGYVKSLFQRDFHNEIDTIKDFFYSGGIVTPDGIISGNHGVPSGSTFTNEIDSIVQYLISTNSKYIFKENMQIQGDDGVYCVSKDNVPFVFDSFTDQGLEVNRDKSIISDRYCTYLQKYYSPNYRNYDGLIGGIYPVYRALLRIVYQERWTDFEDFGILGKDYYSIRTITILENCKHHPLFKELVQFIYSLDKYKLKYSQDGLNKYVSMLTETSGSEGFLFNQYGDDIRGISNFETVKLLSSFA